MNRRDLIRSAAFYSVVFPLVFVAVSHTRAGLFGTPYPSMPNSRLAWTHDKNAANAAFLSNFAAHRRRKPDLVFSSAIHYMPELGVPDLLVRSLEHDQRYWSSANVEVWMVDEPVGSLLMLPAFRRASRIERVEVPAQFPFAFIYSALPAEPGDGAGRH